ncbi:MAG TPA: flagellar basal body-associated FliL family protein [Polyangiaceae bacterium]|nr:flagellar basal body-associated FliL family protein [Polyangiaceae bacterium]
MSENKEKQPAAPARAGGPSLVGMVLPAVFAAAAAFGGAKIASGHHATAAEAPEHAAPAATPGPTLALEPFLLSIADVNKKAHAMKVAIAIEFDPKEKEEALKALTPRIRDATLGHLRTVAYEQVIDPAGGEKMRAEMLEHLRAAGVPTAEHVLITDLVVQ